MRSDLQQIVCSFTESTDLELGKNLAKTFLDYYKLSDSGDSQE